MTPEQAQLKMKDKNWRMNHLYKIKTKDRKLITFKPNRVQAHYMIHKTRRSITLKARQHGVTTYECINSLDETISTLNTNSVIIAHTREKVQSIFEIVKLAFKHLPEELKPRVSFDNRNEMTFPDINSKIYVTMDTRSEMVHNLHISELAFRRDATGMMVAALESVPDGSGSISIESTANGMSGEFYEIWDDPNSEFKKHFYNWMWNEEYVLETDRSWEELELKYAPLALEYDLIPNLIEQFNPSKAQFAWYIKKAVRLRQKLPQEYPTTDLEAFIASGRNVFSQTSINRHNANVPMDKKWNDLLIWELPLKGFKYSIGCDPSEGVGGDNAVIQVLNASTGEQVAELANSNIPPDNLADLLVEIARYYNEAFITIEMNSIGRSTLDRVKTKYYNLYRREVRDRISKAYEKKIGWRTTMVTKPILVNDLEEAIREEQIKINSKQSLNELKVFVRTETTGKQGFGAEGTKKDDRVIALGLAIQGMKQLPRMRAPKTVLQKRRERYIETKKEVTSHINTPYVSPRNKLRSQIFR